MMKQNILAAVVVGISAMALCLVGFSSNDGALVSVCDTVEGEPAVHVVISSDDWTDVSEGALSPVAARVTATSKDGGMITSWLARGRELDLGRDPICAVYEFDRRESEGEFSDYILEQALTCFERNENGTYGGTISIRAGGGALVQRKTSCVYP